MRDAVSQILAWLDPSRRTGILLRRGLIGAAVFSILGIAAIIGILASRDLEKLRDEVIAAVQAEAGAALDGTKELLSLAKGYLNEQLAPKKATEAETRPISVP